MAVMKAFAITSMPFVLIETVTGVASLTTGYLSMPPLLGLGTAIDLTILLAGLGAALVRVSKSGNGSVE